MNGALLLIATAGFSALVLYLWYCEMFSDGFMGSFSRAFNSRRGKNFIALSQPASGLTACFGAMAALGTVVDPDAFSGVRHSSVFWKVWFIFWGIPTVLCMFLIFIGFIPFTLPEWMYPEYHAAKREEQRRQEAAERGESEDRDPFLDDNGVYASQLGNVPVDIPEAVGLPSTAAPHSLQTVPSPGSPLPPHGAPEAGAPALYGPDATPAPHAGTADAFDITAAIASLPRTGTPTSHGARPARASRAHRGNGSPATTPTGTREDPNGDA